MKKLIIQLLRHPWLTINSHKELRYLTAGTASEIVEYISFLLLLSVLPGRLYITNSLSFIIGVITGFYLHKTWTFRGGQQFKTHQQFVGYIALAGINFVAINVFFGIYNNLAGLSPAMAKLAAIATTVIWTYLISNYVIFRHGDKSE